MPVKEKKQAIEAGNIYAVQLNDKEYFFFRVILMIEEQCISPKLIAQDSELAFFSSCGLIEIFKKTSGEVNGYSDNDILIPGLFCSFRSFITNEKWLYAGFKKVNPADIYFPGFVQSFGVYNARYIRGEVALEFEMGMKEVERISIFPATLPGTVLFVLYLYIAGRKDEIPSKYLDLDRFVLSKNDVQFSEYLDTIKSILGSEVDLPYKQLSEKYEFDAGRFYAK